MKKEIKKLLICLIVNAVFFVGNYILFKMEENYILSSGDHPMAISLGTVLFLFIIPLYLLFYGIFSYRSVHKIIKPNLLLIVFLCPFLWWLFAKSYHFRDTFIPDGLNKIILFSIIGVVISLIPALIIKFFRYVRDYIPPDEFKGSDKPEDKGATSCLEHKKTLQ